MEIRIWIIEDDEAASDQIKDLCNLVCTELSLIPDFYWFRTLEEFIARTREESLPDLMIVDLKLGESGDDRSGWDSIKEIITRRIIPVIVYSAFSGDIPEEDFRNALIIRVAKADENFTPVLKKFLRITANFKHARSRIEKEFERLSLETIGKLFGVVDVQDIDRISDDLLVQLAVTRLITFLLHQPAEGKSLPPESIYIYPPFGRNHLHLLAGDFIKNTRSGAIWLVASPSCDLECGQGRDPKVSKVLLLRCYTSYQHTGLKGKKIQIDKNLNKVQKTDNLLTFIKKNSDSLECKEAGQQLNIRIKTLTSSTKVQLKELIVEESKKQEVEEAFQQALVNKAKSELKQKKRDDVIRLLKCPAGIFGSDYLLISFKDYETFSYREIINGLKKERWKILSSLATPYNEDLKNLFMRDLLRLGTPDTSNSKEEEEWMKTFCSI